MEGAERADPDKGAAPPAEIRDKATNAAAAIALAAPVAAHTGRTARRALLATPGFPACPPAIVARQRSADWAR